MARKTLTDKGVAALKPRDKLYAFPDPQCPGHYVRVSPSGGKSYVAVARDPNGKQIWTTIGNAAHLGINAARKKARDIIVRVKDGQDREGPQSFEKVSKEWFKRHVEAKGLLSAKEYRRYLDIHILPAWGGRVFTSIARGDITKLLDHIDDNSGPVAASKVLAIVSAIFNWYAARNDNYNSPVVRGMRRSSNKERARTRILSDDEIRLIWNKSEGTFGDLVKLLLVTAQRRHKVLTMKWTDVSVDGVWTVANGNSREKGTGHELQLPPMALDIIRARPRFASNPYVFAGPAGYYQSYGRGKVLLDKATGPLPHWQLHALRRTARSGMSRLGIRSEVAENLLGHVQPGVVGVYNQYQYVEEKAQALRQLAGLIQSILRNDDADKKVRRLRG